MIMLKKLDRNWQMRALSDITWQSASVPGSIYTDLLTNGSMEDPYFKDNEGKAKALMEKDYEYRTAFSYEPEAWKEYSQILLRFEGVDTVADIYLNDKLLGSPCNMHRTWEYPVKARLVPGENQIRVRIHSPIAYMRKAYEKYQNHGGEDTLAGFTNIRKAHSMSGWDWAACLPDGGLFRPVLLFGVYEASIDSVYIRQHHENGRVRLTAETELSRWAAAEPLSCSMTVTAPDGQVLRSENTDDSILIEAPRLWWPNGMGEQPLYQVEVTLKAGDRILDVWKRQIGLRTLTVVSEKDDRGRSFYHLINGKPVFAMGADYIPEDHLLGRVNEARTLRLLTDCKLSNFNCIRVWGGGYYPDDWFYDQCDRLGLMVWQDFMFACGVYSLDEAFEENLRMEFRDVIRRLRHHACLALWCGNNEMEMYVGAGKWVTKPSEVRDYVLLFEGILPRMLRQYDPDRFYWPSSPSSGGTFAEPNCHDCGDVHSWDVWHGGAPFTQYREHLSRYVSEFGFQAYPSIKTLQTITDDERDLNPYSYVMEKHQRNDAANGVISRYMALWYRYPMNFSDYIYASQLLQADGIRYAVEHFRRNRGVCMGAIYWQMNDCWPVISWSSMDYYGRWKALQYSAKRFFAPIMISCEESGWMSAHANMNRDHFVFPKSIRLNVTNETLQDQSLEVFWEVRNASGEILEEHRCPVAVKALSSVWLEKTELPELDVFTQYVSYRVARGQQVLSQGTCIFSFPKYFKYEDPHLSCRVQGDEIIIHADAYAKSVEILNENQDLVLSDNYFDMNGGERTVRILRGKPESLHLRSVYDI